MASMEIKTLRPVKEIIEVENILIGITWIRQSLENRRESKEDA